MGNFETATAKDRVASRIESDVELVKSMTVRVESSTERVIKNARAMGYFEPPESAKVLGPTPVVTTMAEALQALAHAIDHCSGSLNVFD